MFKELKIDGAGEQIKKERFLKYGQQILNGN